ncbi:hypothetical protein IWQ60_003696 [Tieghemiomyces parasiticus]|uniref:Gamma-glutamyltransferase n=1 Tax=Tieghemiomyces parasiticus TaxID=78921 RepID=A0A9W8AFP4_9FUNG|nr:hypothetical protein IWQ60_003696 [Tieghemiomyces parasiticus]
MFCMSYNASTGKVTGLNGSGRSAASISLDEVRAAIGHNLTELPNNHGFTVNVPGALAGLAETIRLYGSGRFDMADLMAPSIRLAQEGFPVAPITAEAWQYYMDSLKDIFDDESRDIFLINGRAPRAGQIFRNPKLAATMRRIAKDGIEAFYRGPMAQSIVEAVSGRGGKLDLYDLANPAPTFIPETLTTDFRGVRVHALPPNSMGVVTLITLRILDELTRTGKAPNLTETKFGSAEHLHPMIEANRIALADGRWYVSDPTAEAAVYAKQFLDPAYIAKRAQLFDPQRANQAIRHSPQLPHGNSDTVYYSVVDGDGNACSMHTSISLPFGSGISPIGSGFVLHNRGKSFSLDPDSPNVIGPAKRSLHTLTPALATAPSRRRPASGSGRAEITVEPPHELLYSFGVVGSYMQTETQVQLLVNMLAFGDSPQEALDRPRYRADAKPRANGTADTTLMMEEEFPQETRNKLTHRGFQVSLQTGFGRYEMMGRAHIIARRYDQEADQYVLIGATDPRTDGQAIGW